MAPFIESVLEQVKGDVTEALSPERIEQICRELNHVWRDCTLNPITTVYAFLRQVLAGNIACDHVPHLLDLDVTGEAYCKARARLPLELFQRLMEGVARAVRAQVPNCWRGHRLWHVDGSACSMPDTPSLQEAFGQSGAQRPGCGFPVARLLTLFDASTGFLLRVLPAPLRSHDLSRVQRMHEAFQPNDVVVGDRGFCSYAHLALLNLAGVFAVFRIHQATIVNFQKRRPYSPQKRAKNVPRVKGQPTSRWVQSLGRHDQIVEAFKPTQRPSWITPEDFAQAARIPAPTGAALSHHSTGVSSPPGDPRDDALGSTTLPGRRTGQPLSESLADRDESQASETNAPHGRAAHQNSRRDSQRAGHVRHRLQSGALRDAAFGKTPARAGDSDQLHRRPTTTLPCPAQRGPQKSDRCSPPPRSLRATRL